MVLPMTPPKYANRTGQKFSGFVRMHLSVIEAEQLAGMSLERILSDIRAGTDYKDMKLQGFKTALARARLKARAGKLPHQAGLGPPPGTPAWLPATVATSPTHPAAAADRTVIRHAPPKGTFDFRNANEAGDLTHILGPKKGKT